MIPSSLPPERPRPVVVESLEAGRFVPENWLEEAPVTRTLIALIGAMFVVTAISSGRFTDLPSRPALQLGASYAFATVGELRWETLVTACFLHAGLVHAALNMLVLWQAGPLVERSVGSARMAPMYLLAGAFGNVLGVAYDWFTRADVFSVGASGANSGVVAAAFVIGLRAGGWRSPLTQGMFRWLVVIALFGLTATWSGMGIDNAAHLGGALAGAAIAAFWKAGFRYSQTATTWVFAGCGGVLVACVGLVAFRDRNDPFAAMRLQDRFEFAHEALADGRCRDAQQGLFAVERLRANMAPVTSLRTSVESVCGQLQGLGVGK